MQRTDQLLIAGMPVVERGSIGTKLHQRLGLCQNGEFGGFTNVSTCIEESTVSNTN